MRRWRPGFGPWLLIFLLFYLEIQQRIQLVLDGWQGFNQLVSVHGAHHTVGPGKPNRCETHTHPNTQRSHQAGCVCVKVVTLSSSW